MFEQFVDLVHARLAADPQMHVYHYGTYENAALKQLMGTYATREDAVDDLLRRNVFINLHTVVRQGLRAGVDSYSLKEVEALPAFARRAEVTIGMDAVLAYEKWIKSRDAAELESIAEYNEEDCRATLALRDWLAAHHPEDKAWARFVEAKEKKADDDGGVREALRQRLTEDEEPGSVRWLAGELLQYHQREARPGWWWFFERCEKMTDEELLDDSESIGGLVATGEVVSDKNSLIHTLRFPAQQYKLGQDEHARGSRDEEGGRDDRRDGRERRHAEASPGSGSQERCTSALIGSGRPVPDEGSGRGAGAARLVGRCRRRPLPGAAGHPRAGCRRASPAGSREMTSRRLTSASSAR